MSVDNFIPELWAASLLEQWNAENVFANLVNREYEGQATKGNTVHITGVIAPTIHDYKANDRTTTPDTITTTQTDLLIDQEKNYDFLIDDIDNVQVAGDLGPFTQAAAEGLVGDSDLYIANKMVQDGQTLAYSNITTGDGAFDVFGDAQLALNKNKVPVMGRVAIINPKFNRLLVDADSKLTAVDTSGDPAGLREGTIGRILGFRTVLSLHLPESDSPQAVFYHPRAVAYVSQIEKPEARRWENGFYDRIMGLHVYGAKVVRPEGVQVFNELGS